MKSLARFLLVAIIGISYAMPHVAVATIIYQDDFSGAADTLLNGRAPNVVNTTGNTYTASTSLELNGSGQAVSTAAGAFASIAMPALTLDDVVTMTGVFRPRNSSNNWMGFGLAGAAAGVSSDGTAWAFLRGGSHSNGGQVQIWSGNGTTGQLYTTATLPEPGFEGANPSTMTLTYTVRTGNLKVELGSNTVFDGLIDYGGVADTPAPLDAIDHFSFQWNTQLTDTSPTPGYFDSITVSVVPEPATWALLAGSLTAVAAVHRRRRQANRRQVLFG